MKYLTLAFLLLVLAFSVEANAQGESSGKTNRNSCERYKIRIITPPSSIDFKMAIIVPPKNLDQAMVLNPCPEQGPVGAAFIPNRKPQILAPLKEANGFFKVLPFRIKNRYSQ